MTQTERINFLAELAVDNGEGGAQKEIGDKWLRDSLILNVAKQMQRAVDEAASALRQSPEMEQQWDAGSVLKRILALKNESADACWNNAIDAAADTMPAAQTPSPEGPRDEWRTMDSAPTDGTPILIIYWWRDYLNPDKSAGHWGNPQRYAWATDRRDEQCFHSIPSGMCMRVGDYSKSRWSPIPTLPPPPSMERDEPVSSLGEVLRDGVENRMNPTIESSRAKEGT